MNGLHEVACGACGKRHVMSAARARSQRVLRCDCGQFVRLDRALAEAHSEPAPAPAPTPDLADADDDDDDETHMLSSLEAIAALGSGNRVSRASFYEEDDGAATRVASSPVHAPLPSVPPARPSSPARRPSSPVQRASIPAADKPLWYVDLGGAETVEMTIEQLIIARRSGKLGEGALVWRAGMPRWRSVGSLIPAAGSGAPRVSVPPAAPVRAEPQAAPAPPALGSYERPLATLEFALEKAENGAPRAPSPTRTPSPAKLRPPSQPPPPRAPTPIPRPPPVARGASQVGPLPAPAPLPVSARHSTPPPPPTPPSPPSTPPAQAVSAVSPLMGRASPMPPPERARQLMPAALRYPWRGPRPRWLSVAIAVAICVAASGSGAFVVRALKLKRQPLSLSPTQANASSVPLGPALPTTTVQAALPATAPTTEVVDVDSLSVEHHAPRATWKAATPAAPVTPAVAPNADKNLENGDSEDTSAPPAAPQPSVKKVKTSDLPAVAHSNPYTTGPVGDSNAKKPAPSNGDDPGF